MARKFLRGEVLPSTASITVKLGAQGAPYKDTEIGKFVKIGTLDSQHVLCAVGDFIDGYITSVEAATSDGFSIGGIQRDDYKYVVFDGSQAAGTGAITLGQYVVAGTPVALGSPLGTAANAYARVRSATAQPGTTVPADLAAVAAHLAMVPYLWRVASLGPVGTGAVGTVGLIERVPC